MWQSNTAEKLSNKIHQLPTTETSVADCLKLSGIGFRFFCSRSEEKSYFRSWSAHPQAIVGGARGLRFCGSRRFFVLFSVFQKF